MCVQLGNFVWSEECLGLTVGDLVFIKHSNRLRGAVRLCLPLNTILKGEIKLLFLSILLWFYLIFLLSLFLLFSSPLMSITYCLLNVLTISGKQSGMAREISLNLQDRTV